MAHVVYDKLKETLLDGTDLNTSDIKILLVQETNPTIVTSATMVGNTLSTEYSGTSATPLTETSGTGYTAGGQSMTNVDNFNDGTIIGISADNVSWGSSTITAGGALIYITATPYTSGVPLIYFDFSAERSSSENTFGITWNSEGIIELQ